MLTLRRRVVPAVIAAGLFWPISVQGWGPQGHRVIALVASNHLSVSARRETAMLLQGESLPGVSMWADDIRAAEPETGPWHYVNLPPRSARYDRERHCPRPAPARDDGWRDCAVDRILFAQHVLRDGGQTRVTRARALKFLVHLVGDLHQPLHAIDVSRGGSDVPVSVFGSSDCGPGSRGGRRICNLHGAWDSSAVTRRRLDDQAYAARLERAIRANQWRADSTGPEAWAIDANRLAVRILVAPGTNLTDRYFAQFDRDLDELLAKAGLRLAAVLNQALAEQ